MGLRLILSQHVIIRLNLKRISLNPKLNPTRESQHVTTEGQMVDWEDFQLWAMGGNEAHLKRVRFQVKRQQLE